MEKEDLSLICEHLNAVIEQAIIHGGDAGGAYYVNKERLLNEIETLLSILGIYNEVIIYKDDVPKILEKSKLSI